MHTGLLWYDGDRKKSVHQKIDDGVRRFEQKYEKRADTVIVNPADQCKHPRLRVVVSKLVQPNHFLIGIEESKAGDRRVPSR